MVNRFLFHYLFYRHLSFSFSRRSWLWNHRGVCLSLPAGYTREAGRWHPRSPPGRLPGGARGEGQHRGGPDWAGPAEEEDQRPGQRLPPRQTQAEAPGSWSSWSSWSSKSAPLQTLKQTEIAGEAKASSWQGGIDLRSVFPPILGAKQGTAG